MLYTALKVAITAVLVVAVSEAAKRSVTLGAIIASLPLTSLLAIILAMMTTLLTLGMLVFSATQAISSFGIVLVSGIFTAFLLSPLAMPGKKEKKRR